VRESIVNPQAKIVDGFPPIMPTFQGLVTEEQLLQLIAYVRSLGEATPTRGTGGPPTTQAPGRN
jgi:cytochrome c oxidase subunit 2